MSRIKANPAIVGRLSEQATLTAAIQSADAELIAVFGRRRVGKTFLIHQFFQKQLVFELTGLHGESMQRQLQNFSQAFRQQCEPQAIATPTSWLEAFEQLRLHIENRKIRPNSKHVVFFDELPWLATARSGFMAALESFWNTFASRRNDIIVVVCGSAASWMIRKVIGSKGGLHNRTSRRIRLQPFDLHETRQYLRHRRIKLDDFQIAQLYMAVGGIPQYLKHVEPGRSVAQIIDQLCFAKDGLLKDEFQHLYAALFDNHEIHEAIVRSLSSAAQGLTRNEILKKTAISTGGGFTTALRELTECSFIQEHPAHGNVSKNTKYRLADEYSLFYLNWIETNRTSGKDAWLRKATGRKYRTWTGYAFETLCLKHVAQLKRALGIQNVETSESGWRHQAESKIDEGAQIDLVIDRRDHCTNLCEMKFSEVPFTISKRYAGELERKVRVFRQHTGTRNTLFLTMVTAFGLQPNNYAKQLITSHVELCELFEPA